MKKLLLVFLLLLNPLLVFAEINECKTDVYFANGILTKQRTAIDNAGLLEDAIIEKFGIAYYTQKIGKVDYAYNQTQGFLPDGLETFLQKFGWQALADTIIPTHAPDLKGQIDKYKTSIEAGHKVLVVAHSQGNLFTFEAYNALPGWMQNYFEAVSVASPMKADIKPNTTRINLDNDIVPRIARLGASSANDVKNNVRAVKWYKPYDPTTTDHGGNKPDAGYAYKEQLGQVNDGFTAEDAGIDFASQVHAFTFYMGQPLGIDDGAAIGNMFTNEILVNTTTKTMIMQEVGNKLAVLNEKLSQWKTNSTCLTNDHNATLTHIAEALPAIAGVYVDDANGKLFNDGQGYVKAPCGTTVEREDDNASGPDPKSGIITVDLQWEHHQVDMELVFDAGEKDIADVEDVAREHYYVATENDISPGTYTVSVYGFTDVPFIEKGAEQCGIEEEPIIIGIKAPGANAILAIDARSAYELNVGAVAEIKVSEKGTAAIKSSGGGGVQTLCLNDCPSSGSGGGISGVYYYYNYYNYYYELTVLLPKAELGPLVGADINIYPAQTYDANATPLMTGTTTEGSTIYTSGLINLPGDLVAQLEDERYYVVAVHGGSDVDANDDKVLDNTPTVNHGTLHALLSGAQMKAKGYKVNILTELAYQSSKRLLDELNTFEEITEILDASARRLLKEDINKDDIIDAKDLFKWIPSEDKEKLSIDYNTYIHPLVQKIYAGEDIGDDAFNMLFGIDYTTTTFNIAENNDTSFIGNLGLLPSHHGVTSITLSGNDAGLFTIDENATLSFKQSIIPDYEVKSFYEVEVNASNGYYTESQTIVVSVQNIPETAPVLHDLNVSLSAYTNPKEIVGNILVAAGDTPIESINITGTSDFRVDKKGNIYTNYTFAQNAQTTYDFSVVFNDVFGESNSARIHVDVTYERVVGSIDMPAAIAAVTPIANTDLALASVSYSKTALITMGDSKNPEIISWFGTDDMAPAELISMPDKHTILIGDRGKGLLIYDISDVEQPNLVSATKINGWAEYMAVSSDGNYVFISSQDLIGDTDNGLEIIDISDPKAPQVVSSLDVDNGHEIALMSDDNTLLFLANNTMQILDVTDKTSPQVIAEPPALATPMHLSLSKDESRAYVVSQNHLFVLDISNIYDPVIIGSVGISPYPTTMALSEDGTRIFIGYDTSAMQIVDVSQPKAPKVIDSIEVFANEIKLLPERNEAIIGNSKSQFALITLEKTAPAALSGIALIAETNAAIGQSIGTLMFDDAVKGASFKLVGDGADDFSIDANGSIVVAVTLDYSQQNVYQLKAVATKGDSWWEANADIRLHGTPEIQPYQSVLHSMSQQGTPVGTLDMWIDNEDSLHTMQTIGAEGSYFKIESNGSIYVAPGTALHHFEKSSYTFEVIASNDHGENSPTPVQVDISPYITTLKYKGDQTDMLLSDDGNLAYVIADGYFLQFFDISNPITPKRVNSVQLENDVSGVVRLDETHIIVWGRYGFSIVDVSDTEHPRILGNLYTFDFIESLTLTPDKRTLLVEDAYRGIQVIDISNTGNPLKIAKLGFISSIRNMQISSDAKTAYMTGEKVKIANISNPYSITELATVDALDSTYDTALSTDNTTLLVINRSSDDENPFSFNVIDVSIPSAPIHLGQIPLNGTVYDMQVSFDQKKAYVATKTNEAYQLNVIDFSNASSPVIELSYPLDGHVHDLTLAKDEKTLFVTHYTEGNYGLYIYDVTQANTLKQISEIPLNGNATNLIFNSNGTLGYFLINRTLPDYTGYLSTAYFNVIDLIGL